MQTQQEQKLRQVQTQPEQKLPQAQMQPEQKLRKNGGETASSGTTNSGGFTDEQLTNTDQTRTIYRNSDGKPTVIQPDSNGNWVDFDGNTYSFANDQDVYAADGTDYYWHGEAADVYYMPLP